MAVISKMRPKTKRVEMREERDRLIRANGYIGSDPELQEFKIRNAKRITVLEEELGISADEPTIPIPMRTKGMGRNLESRINKRKR